VARTVSGFVTAGAFGGSASSRIKTQCLTDFFSVTGSGSGAPPTICGTNTNQHGKNYFQRVMKLKGIFDYHIKKIYVVNKTGFTVESS
jgi:hypothetical protein